MSDSPEHTTKESMNTDRQEKGSREEGSPVGQPCDGTIEIKLEKLAEPPDGGWGWVVVAGCLLGHVLLVGMSRSFGIFYVALIEKFDVSASEATWVPTIFNCIRMVIGPLVSWLCDRYTCRLVVMVGGIVFGLGCVTSAFANGITYLCVSFGVIAAVGAGCLFTPMFIMLNAYFDKNKGKAMSFATFGSGIGTFVMAVLVTYLLAEYSYFGAMLIVGGLMFNITVVGAVFRPLAQTNGITEDIPLSTRDDAPSEKHDKNSTKCLNFCSALKNRLKLVTNTTFLLYGFIVMSMPFCINLPLVFLPALCKEYGLPDHKTKAAMLLSTMSFSDMVGRLVFAFVFDLPWVRPRRRPVHSCVGLLLGISVLLLPFMPNFWTLFGMCIVWGFVESGYHSQRATIQATFLPRDQVSNSVGFMIFFQGIGIFTSTRVAGEMADALNTYRYSFVLGGCVMIFFVSIFLIEYFVRKSRDQAQTRLNVVL